MLLKGLTSPIPGVHNHATVRHGQVVEGVDLENCTWNRIGGVKSFSPFPYMLSQYLRVSYTLRLIDAAIAH